MNHNRLEGPCYNIMSIIPRFLNKPLTPLMIKTLIDCNKKELMNAEPCAAPMTPSITGLVMRGMMITRPYTSAAGKTFLAAYVTKTGKAYLTNLFSKP